MRRTRRSHDSDGELYEETAAASGAQERGADGRASCAGYQSWVPSMDEGWTRFLFDQNGIPYRRLVDADVRKGERAMSDTQCVESQVRVVEYENWEGTDRNVMRL
jgi:hypothetical protein